MWRTVCTSILLSLSLVATPSAAQAFQKPTTSCSKLGITADYSGVHYRCAASGKKLIWVKSSPVKKPAKGTTVQTPALNSKLKQSIGVPLIRTVDISAGKFTGTFSTNSKLPVELSTRTPLICSVKDQSVFLLQTGSCLITAIQPGNEKYLPAQPVSFSFEINPPTITSDNALFDEVQTFVRVPMGTSFTSDTAEITLTNFLNDATGKVCADDSSALGCTLINGVGMADPSSQTRYVEFNFHLKNLDANPLPSISYRLLLDGVISDIDIGVTLDTLSNITLGSGESADGSFFGVVPINLNLANAYLIIDEGITDSSVKLLLALSNLGS